MRDDVLKLISNSHILSGDLKPVIKLFDLALIISLLLLGSCSVSHKKEKANINNKTKFSSAIFGVKGSPRITTSKKVRKGGGRYQVGKPYKIRGKWYYPKEQPGYNKSGVASWYGPNFHGRLTANGEVYDQNSLSAAHPTLPLPSYARVTNLENGSSVIVRVNDRGPFSDKRIIDLSARASKMLGYQKQGLAKVRVRYLGKARMDGRDSRYLMASYSPARGRGIFERLPVFAPGASKPGTMIAGITAPLPPTAYSQTARNRLVQPGVRNTNILLSGFVPVPAVRPTQLYEGSILVLANANSMNTGRLKPLGYLQSSNYNERIIQAFSVIDNIAVQNEPHGSEAQ